jgi:hypothetical protein
MNKQLLLLGVAAVCLALGACTGDGDGDEKTECKTAADCAEGEICDNGTCKPDEKPACDPACGGATPICDEATGTCLACTATEGCSGGTPFCDTEANDGVGACVACRSTEDCTEPSVCDPETHTCVGCTETEGCGGDTPVCDDGTCVACTATAGCETGKVCDTSVAGGACVTCLADGSGCESGQLCDTSVTGGTCVNCFPDGTGCPASAPACDTSVPGGTCVQCTSSEHCSGMVETRLCDTARNVCVTCNDANEGCREPWPYCDVSANEGAGECVDCLSDDHCGGNYPHCNLEDNRCRTCVTDDHCPDKENAPHCDPQYPGQCRACVDNSHCGGDTPVCDPYANNGVGACVACTANEGCEAPQFCDIHVPGGLCANCTETVGCPRSKICDRSEGPGVCVACLEDGTGCEEGQVCDTSVEGHACANCLADGTGCDDGLVCDTSVPGGACATCLPDGTGCDDGESCVAGACRVTASLQIEAVKAAAVGTGLSLPIDGAYVTYVRPQVGGAPAGFFIQAEATGPAVVVTVDPATLDPVPAVGDQVSFTVTEKDEYGAATEIAAIDNWTKGTATFDVSAFVQNLSAATDVITALDDYESELVSFTGTFTGAFASAGSGHVSATFSTVGFPSGDDQLVLRMPQTVQQEMDLVANCSFTLVAGPMNRYNANAQPSAYRATDFTGITCPAPTMVSAGATAADTVVVNFDRLLDPASVLADGSQFTIDPPLAVTAAGVGGKQVTLTTAPQTGGTTYTVTVAATVTGFYGAAVVPPATPVTFDGFAVVAGALVINEVDYDQPSTDTEEFIEIFNGTNAAVDLSELDMVFVNGASTGSFDKKYALSGTLAPNGYAVLANPGVTVPTGVIKVEFPNNLLQNGEPDAIFLYNRVTKTVIDSLSYGGSNPTPTITYDGISVSFPAHTTLDDSGNDAGRSLIRSPNGLDTDSGADWFMTTVVTPGAANVLAAP